MDFNAVFTVKFTNKRTRDSELHPPHLISVAILPSESQNTKNVILQRDIPKKIASDDHSLIKVDQGHHVPEIYLFRVLYKAKIHDIDDP